MNTNFTALFTATLAMFICVFIFGWLAGYKASEVKIAERVAFVCRGEK